MAGGSIRVRADAADGAAGATPGANHELSAKRRIMIADDRPMLPMDENRIALERTYRNLGLASGSAFPAWQIALLDWWRFIGRREGIDLLRRPRSGQADGADSAIEAESASSRLSPHAR